MSVNVNLGLNAASTIYGISKAILLTRMQGQIQLRTNKIAGNNVAAVRTGKINVQISTLEESMESQGTIYGALLTNLQKRTIICIRSTKTGKTRNTQ